MALSQPELRAGLEQDLKAICEGRKNPEEVLRQQVEIYKNCYQTIQREVASLDQAVGIRFGAEPERNAQAIEFATVHQLFKCPKCQSETVVLRRKKDNNGSFFGCQGYPECRHSIWLERNLREITSLDEKCTNCNKQYHKVKIKFSQNFFFSQVDEVPAYSRIEQGYYITCIYCDPKVREVLDIKTEDVKILGNVVSAAARPIVERSVTAPRVNQLANGNQTRSFGTTANINNRNNSTNRSDNPHPNGPTNGWFSNNNDRNRGNNTNHNQNQFPSSRNNTFDQQQTRNNWFNHSNDGSTSGRPSWMDDKKKDEETLKRFPNVQCHCKVIASKFIAKKDGPNKNRPFYTCSRKSCKFFHWADTPLPQNIQTVQGGTITGPKKCGVCRQPGHNRKNCPNIDH